MDRKVIMQVMQVCMVGNRDFNFLVNGSYLDSKGINIATQGSERDGYENSSLNINTSYRPNEILELGIRGRYTNGKNEFDPAPLGVPEDGQGRNDVEQVYGRAFGHLYLFDEKWTHKLEATMVDTGNVESR